VTGVQTCALPICHPYTRALLSAIPVPNPQADRQRSILAGDVPSPINPPSGCRFHTRCAFASPRCSQEAPVLEDGVACHHWRELPAAAPLPSEGSTAGAERLRRLQAKFLEPVRSLEISAQP
jgi:oligopeptide transport system ATP-binding protein